jgi:protocatechuate 3,4-dioxygenase beta subunit
MVKNNEELRFRTPTTEDGPMYPPEPIPRRADLTNGGKAKGELLILMGVVHDHRRTPVSGAIVEIWQSDSNGYYDHPRARGSDALDEHWKIERNDLDPNFRYFGSVETDTNGVYWFQTIRPLSYRVFGFHRAAHIHMKVRSMNHGVLTTEVYFPGDDEEKNREGDRVFQSREEKSDFIVNFTSDREQMLEGVPDLGTTKYCRRDIFFR